MRNVTLLALALAAVAFTTEAQAQACSGTLFERVNVSEINAVPQDDIDFLNANESTLTIPTIQERLTSPLIGQEVEFTAVILSDPYKSGVRSLNEAGIPNSIQAFVRDVDAATMGVEGMGILLNDERGNNETATFRAAFPGTEIIVCGFVDAFENTGGKAYQIDVTNIVYTSTIYGPDDPLRQPVVIQTDDILDIVNGQTQIDWSLFPDFVGQYVRFEGISIVAQQNAQTPRPDILFSTPTQETEINLYDVSVCYRNDRDATYFPAATGPPPCVTNGPFVPPATGTLNLQGFLVFQGDDGGFDFGSPDEANWNIVPVEESDFDITTAPPAINVTGPESIPGPSDDVTISAVIIPAEGTITSAVVDYTYEATGETGQATLTNTSGDTYTGTIPAGPNGSFVTYTVSATDSQSLTGTSDELNYLIFGGAVNSIAVIQTTIDGGVGGSPLYTGENGLDSNGGALADDPIAFDLDVVVQSVFQSGNSYLGTFQEDPDLGPFSGIWVFFGSDDPGLTAGDRINITEASINERYGLTQLQNLEFTTTSTGDPYPYKMVSTDLFVGAGGNDAAEAHEGILVQFNDVVITDPAVNDFGEWDFASVSSPNASLRADDQSDALDGFNEMLEEGQQYEFFRGPLTYTFGFNKLIPVTMSDIGALVDTAIEGGIEARSIRILGTSPNPARATARVEFELDQAGPAALRVFDVTGREVAVLAEGTFAAAAHTADLNTGALSPGVYVLRLEAGGEIATMRLAVVR